MRTCNKTRGMLVSLIASSAMIVSACGDSTGGGEPSADSDIVIGVSTPQTGPGAINDQVADGIDAYFKYRNSQGGVDGRDVEVKFVDNQYTGPGGATAVRKILADDPFAVVSLSGAPFAGSISVLKTAPDTPALVLAGGQQIREANLPNAFGLYTDYTTESFAAIEHLVGLGKTKLALVFDPTVNGEAALKTPDFAKEAGAEIVTKVEVPVTTTNFTPIVQKLQDSDIDGIVFQTTVPSFVGTMKAADQAGLDVPVVGLSALLSESVLELGGESLEGAYLTGLFPLLSDPSPAVQQFREQMKKYAPNAENGLGMVGWNAAALMYAGIQDASEDGDLTRDSFMESLRGLGGQQVGLIETLGWSGDNTYSLDGGDPEVFSVYQVTDGEFVKVEP